MTAAAVVVLPLVLLMVTVMLLAVASLVIPARRQRYLLAVLDRLVKIATALRGSSKQRSATLELPYQVAACPLGGVSHENHPAEVSPGWLDRKNVALM